MKKTIVLACLAVLLFAGIAAQNAQVTGASTSHPQPQQGTMYRVSIVIYQLQHTATISAALIHLVLAGAHSPAVGDSQALYDLGVHYGIDPVYALAFFRHESKFGTTGEARVTKSLGNERCIVERPCIDQANGGGYALMRSWVDGFDRWYSLILNLYIKQWHRFTVEQIIPKYAPNSDGNNEAKYIASIEQDVVQWRAESQASA